MSKHSLEFLEDTHQYLLDGELIPSVSEIISFNLDEYSSVPQKTLEKAAAYGTRIHEIIENWFTFKEDYMTDEEIQILKSFTQVFNEKKLFKGFLKEGFIEVEKPVYTKDYAGTVDMIVRVGTKLGLYDFKTNAKYPEEHLKLQLNLYRKAYEELNRKKVDELGCFWWNRKKKKFEYHDVDFLTDEEIEELIINFKTKNKLVSERNEIESINIYEPSVYRKLVDFYLLKNEIDEIEKKIKPEALKIMKERAIKSFKNDDFTFSYKPSYEREDVDKDKLIADGLFDKYKKVVKVKESVSIRFNGKREINNTD